MDIKGLDISAYQSDINYDSIINEGNKFVIIKAGEGYVEQSMFKIHYNGCKSRNIMVGCYWYSNATTEAMAISEAKNCISALKDKQLELPVYYDVEMKVHTTLGKSKLTNIIKAFCDTVKEAGYEAGIYINPSFMENYVNKNDLIGKYHIWLAHWTWDPNKKSKYDYGQEIWQWGTTKIDGKDVDANISFIEWKKENKKGIVIMETKPVLIESSESFTDVKDKFNDAGYYVKEAIYDEKSDSFYIKI